MTYAATAEILIHLNEFSINDSYSEGIYRMRSSVYYEKTVQKEDQNGNKLDTVEFKVG